MDLPLVDLKRQHDLIKSEIESSMKKILRGTQFILGENVELFEKEFAQYCGLKYAVGVASGTDALLLSLETLGIGDGDEVITVPNTFIATVDAISRRGAKPVFVDIDPATYNIDVNRIEEKISAKTKAIIPVHLYGQPADMKPIIKLAKAYDLKVIEDSCQAHGAEYEGQKAGALGDIGCFSFYPSKNLGAYGDAGMIVANKKEIIEELQMLRNYGQRRKYYHDFIGYNSRLDEVQATLLRVKLRYLDSWNNSRRKSAELYDELLRNIDHVTTPLKVKSSNSVYHLYVIRCSCRDGLKNYLCTKGIETGIHYPIPIHLQQAYKHLKYKKGSFPVTEEYANRILSLPLFPEIRDDEIGYVCENIKEFCGK